MSRALLLTSAVVSSREEKSTVPHNFIPNRGNRSHDENQCDATTIGSTDDTFDTFEENFNAVLQDIAEIKNIRSDPVRTGKVLGSPALEMANQDQTAAALNYIWTLRAVRRSSRTNRQPLSSRNDPSFEDQSFKSLDTGALSTESTPLVSVSRPAPLRRRRDSCCE
jgi:hypothetical protein